MGVLYISLFGKMKFAYGEWDNAVKLTRLPQLLLAYLLLERDRLHHRDILAGLFWGEQGQQQARNCLNTALWRIRKAFVQEGLRIENYLITAHSGELGFDTASDHWLDVEILDDQCQRIMRKPVVEVSVSEAQDFEHSLELYTGDLLDGVYEDWALRAKEQKRLLYISGLVFLMEYYRHCRVFPKSIGFGQKVLDLDPLREEIHRDLMTLYFENGQRALAVRQYEVCRQHLSRELGIAPMVETENLFRRIITDNSKTVSLAPAPAPENLQQLLLELRCARSDLDQSVQSVYRAQNRLEDYLQRSNLIR